MFLVEIVDPVYCIFQLQMEFAQDNVFWQKSFQIHNLCKRIAIFPLRGASYPMLIIIQHEAVVLFSSSFLKSLPMLLYSSFCHTKWRTSHV